MTGKPKRAAPISDEQTKVPRTSPYRLGRQVEYSVRRELSRLGFFCMRSPASRGPVDLVALRSGLILMIQCKRSLALPPDEWNSLYDLAQSCGAVAILAGRERARGVSYFRLTDRKGKDRAKQPMTRVDPSVESL